MIDLNRIKKSQGSWQLKGQSIMTTAVRVSDKLVREAKIYGKYESGGGADDKLASIVRFQSSVKAPLI